MNPSAGEALVADAVPPAAAAIAEGAFRRFYEATARPLWAFLAAATRDSALADDLMQESFVRLLASGFQAESAEHRRRYLFRIASNLLHDHRRASRRILVPLDEAELLAAGSATDRGAERRDLWRALSTLTPRDRQLLWLAHIEEMTHAEIAGVLGLARASVRVLLFRARRRLAAALDRPHARLGADS